MEYMRQIGIDMTKKQDIGIIETLDKMASLKIK